jgi:hypothetical protein
MSRIFRVAEIYHQQDSTCDEAPDALTAAIGADVLGIPTDHAYIAKTTGDDAEALTLANGKPGQLLVVNHVDDGAGTGDGTITPVTSTGWATVVLADAGDQVVFLYIDDIIGWIIISAFGLTNQPEITQ